MEFVITTLWAAILEKKSEMNTLKEKTIIMQIALIDHWPGEQTAINKTR